MSQFTYPDRLPITPLTKPPAASVTVPGSKSITNRALVLAALGCATGCQGCELEGALSSEDTEVMAVALRQLGFLQVAVLPANSRRFAASTNWMSAPNSSSTSPVLAAATARPPQSG